MNKILICDDSPEEAQKLSRLLDRYSAENNTELSVTTATQQDDIMTALTEQRYDILFLDIYMDQLNGIDLAKLLREQGISSKIVFFSTSPDHALEAYGVNATQYFVKPVSYEKLAAVMSQLQPPPPKTKSITFELGHSVLQIPLDEILYTEGQRNYQRIIRRGGREERVRLSSKQLYDLFVDCENMLRVGASFIVNMDCIERLTPKEITLFSGGSIPIPRNSYSELKKAYFDYYRSEAEGGGKR